ncbi:MAG: hypothetical protein ACRC7O_04775, partial [Fimbriiglobus sp.]
TPSARLTPFARVTVIVHDPAPRPARRRAARSRLALAVGAVAFLAGQAALNAAIRADVVPVRDPVFSEKLTLFQGHSAFFAPRAAADPPRLLALGSSRTQLAFDAGECERLGGQTGRPVRTFNFGCAAAGPMTIALYFRRILAAGADADFVLIEIHPGMAAGTDPPFEARWLHGYRLTPDEVTTLRQFGWAVPTPPHHGWKGWVSASHGFRMAILNRYAPTFLLCPFGLTVGAKMDGFGYVAGQAIPRDIKPRALERTREQYAPTFGCWHGHGVGEAAVRDVLAHCRERNIRAAVLLTPESSEYRGWYGDDGFARVGTFAASFGVPVADARTWVPDEWIADGHHLTAAGAKVFTERLTREFVGPWVNSGEPNP